MSPRQLTLAIVLIASCVLAASPAHGEGPAIVFGTKDAVALRTNGEVLTWGENVYCQLGRQTSAAGPRRDWQQQIKDTFDYASLAALID